MDKKNITLAKNLVDWYWEYGIERQGAYLPQNNWLFSLYRQYEVLQAINESPKKPSLAIWGPSQAGKSTSLSNIIDSTDTPQSAMMWNDDPFVFHCGPKLQRILDDRDEVYPKSFNPYHGGGDASACVSRFYISETVKYDNYPVEVKLTKRRDILHSLAEGYISECELELDTGEIKTWEPKGFLDLIKANEKKIENAISRDKKATELIIDLIQVIERLISDGSDRYRNLGTENLWRKELIGELLSNPILHSSYSIALNLVENILWDSRYAMNEIFNDLNKSSEYFLNKVKGASIHCSLKLSRLLVDIEAYKKVEDDTRSYTDSDKAYLESVFLDKRGDDFILCESGSKKGIFVSDLKDNKFFNFGLFQALTWELSFPLKKSFFKGNDSSDSSWKVLETLDILDIPGVSKEDTAAKDSLFDASKKIKNKADFFSSVLKRGKTATIIHKYAEDLRIDAILLLIKSGEFPSKADKLSRGVKRIWEELDKKYSIGDRKKIPVPLSICITFFYKTINDLAHNHNFDLLALNSFTKKLGAISEADTCYNFVTNSPWLPNASLDEIVKESPERISDRLVESEWAKSKFLTDMELMSLKKSIVDIDGGVSYLFKCQEGLVSLDKFNSKHNKRNQQVTDELKVLLFEVSPLQEDSNTTKLLLPKLRKCLIEKVANIKSQNNDEVANSLIDISNNLQKILSFTEKDLDSLPESKTDIPSYLERQLKNWSKDRGRIDALFSLGLERNEALVLLEMMGKTIPLDDVAMWILEWWHGELEENVFREESKNARRYVSMKLTNILFGHERKESVFSNYDEIRKNVEDCYIEWHEQPSLELALPHDMMVIESSIEQLLFLEDLIDGESSREEQPGDIELVKLHELFIDEKR